MTSSKRMDSMLFNGTVLLFVGLCVGVFALPKVVTEGAKTGLNYSFGILVPSLFPFMFLSGFAVQYGISDRMGRFIAPFTEKALYLPGDVGVTVLLSFIGGFPVGAVGIDALYKQGKITHSQALRMLCFCVNSGPAFLITVVGTELFGSELIGIILFAAQTTASLIAGILLGIIARKKEMLQRTVLKKKEKTEFAAAFISSAKTASSSAITMCALIVLFSAFEALFFKAFHIDDTSFSGIIIKSLLEVTDGCSYIAKAKLPLWAISLAVGWGGICVHFQIFAAAEDVNINRLQFFTARFAGSVLCAVLTFIICHTIPAAAEVFSNFENGKAVISSTSFYGSFALFLSNILFVIYMAGIGSKYKHSTKNYQL